MTITLVETSDEEPTIATARYIADLAWADAGEEVAAGQITQFCEEAEQLLVSGRNFELVGLLLTSQDDIFARAPEKDIECIFGVACNLVARTEDLDQAMATAKKIAAVLTSQPGDKAALRLKMLFQLYNTVRTRQAKFFVFMQILEFALAAKVTDLVMASIKRLEVLTKEWQLDNEEQRALQLAVTSILQESKSNSKESFQALSKYLGSFSKARPEQLVDVQEHAVRAAVEFIKSPDMFQSDLLDMPPIRQLESDARHKKLFQLLTIFLTGRLDAYNAFYSANNSVLKTYGLSHEECVSKMRLLSLTSLAADHPTGEIPYAVVRDTLKVSEGEVETWIVKAIAHKLIEARMDQLRQVVVVTRHTQRVFGQQQWRDLRSKLAGWKENIGRVSQQLQVARASGDGLVGQGLQAH